MATRTIGTEIVLSGEKQFNDAMKGVNNNLKNLRTDMAAVSSEFDDNANSMEALTSKQKILRQSVEQHEAKVDALQKMYDRQKEKFGENSAQADKFRQQLNEATVALNKQKAALDKNADAMKGKYLGALKSVLSAGGGLAKTLGMGLGYAAAGAAAGTAAIGAGGALAVAKLVEGAREAAEAAKAAQEAGETLTENQQQWLAFSGQLDALSGSAAGAKTALSAMLLPALSDLSAKGTQFLNDFTADMEAASGDTEAQTQIMADYIVKGVELIREKLPKYLQMGKDLILSLGEGLADAGAVDEVLGFVEDLIGDLLSTVVQLAPRLAQGGVELVGKLGMSLVENAPLLLQGGLELILGILQGLANGFSDIYNSGPEIIEMLKQSFTDSKEVIKDVGGEIIDFIWQGILDAWDDLTEWFNNLWDKLFEGRNINIGVEGGTGSPQNSGLSYVPYNGFLAQLHQGEMVLTREQAAAYRRGMGGGKSVNVNIYTQQLSEGDINMVVDIVNRKLGDDL